MNPIRVLIVEDHGLVRAGFCALLEAIDDITVVGQAGDGHSAIESIGRLHPRVVLMDISMPGMNGLEATRRIVAENPAVRVVVLSMHAGEEYVLQALQAGARGYLIKDAATVELALAVRAVAQGQTYLSPQVSQPVIDAYRRRQQDAAKDPLTPRQREILQLIAEGQTTKDIARRLNLSIKTVDTHRTQLMDRLGIHDIAGLVRYAIRTGLASADT